MIPDRIIEQGTLTTDGGTPPSRCASPGTAPLPGVLHLRGLARRRRRRGARRVAHLDDERRDATGSTSSPARADEWWFPLDSAVVSGRPAVVERRRRAPGRRRAEALHPLHRHRRRRGAPDRGARHQDHGGRQHEGGRRVTALGSPIQGVTLYSFTRAFHGRRVRPRGADPQGRAPTATDRGSRSSASRASAASRRVDDAYVGWFKDLVAEVGLVQTSLAINADIGIHRDRLLDQDELIEYMRAADRGGARSSGSRSRACRSRSSRTRWSALAPVAEQYGVTLALEVHADQYASHPRILALRDRYEQVGSPFLGFTADWGATTVGFAPVAASRPTGDAAPPRTCSAKVVDALGRVLRGRAARGPGRSRAALRPRSSGSPPRTAARTSASTSASTAPASSGRRGSTTGSRSCRGSGTCTASSSASTSTARSRRSRCATSSGCSSSRATTARSRASTRAGTGTTGRARSRSSRASRPCSAPPRRPPAPA